MAEIPIDRAEIAQARNRSLLNLAKAPRRPGAGETDDPLINIAIRRRADTVQFTQVMLKNRLTEDLDQTIADHLRDNPHMQDDTYIGILTDGTFRTEVIAMEAAVASVEDMPFEQADQLMRRNPVGYFSSADFSMKTPEDPAYQSLQRKLDHFFERNSDVFDYLRQQQGS